MNWIDPLERRFGRFAIPNLVRLVVVLNALVFIILRINPAAAGVLDLTAQGLARHEYWRLMTFLFIPGTNNLLFLAIALSFLWMLGEGLEQALGAFRLNLFYLVGMAGTAAAAVFFGTEFSNLVLNASLLFAFAWYFPDVVIYLFFILPVRMRWLAWITGGWFLLQFVAGTGSMRMALLASFANYLLFFGPEIVSRARQRRQVTTRRRNFAANSLPQDEPLHRCAVCGRTDRSDPQVEFRVSRDGNDYCLEHLPK